jgi:hypothetical protein
LKTEYDYFKRTKEKEQMSDLCTITISGNGKPVTAELPTKEATALAELAELLGGAPRRPGDLSAEEIALRSKRREEAEGGGALLSELGALTDEQIVLVRQYVRLVHFGDKGLCSNENWILELINDLLYECIYDGIGGALTKGPGEALRGLADSYAGFCGSIDQIREARKEYPELFKDAAADAAMTESLIALERAVDEHGAAMASLQKRIKRGVLKIARKRNTRQSVASGARRTRARASQA